MHDAPPRLSPSGNTDVIAPQTIANDLLEFIRATRSESDLERRRFWKALRFPLHELSQSQYSTEENGYQAFTQELADTNWSYTVSFNEAGRVAGSKSVSLRFEHPDNRAENTDIDLGPICEVDFDGYHSALTQAGYLEGPPEPSRFEFENKAVTTFVFSRGDVHVWILTQQEAAQPEAKRRHACVISVEARTYSQSRKDEEQR